MRKIFIVMLFGLMLSGCCSHHLDSKGLSDKPVNEQIGAVVSAVRTANIATAPLNPYAPVIEGVLGTIALALGVFGYKMSGALKAVGLKYEAHKRAVEAEMRSASPQDAEAIYESVGSERKKLGIL